MIPDPKLALMPSDHGAIAALAGTPAEMTDTVSITLRHLRGLLWELDAAYAQVAKLQVQIDTALDASDDVVAGYEAKKQQLKTVLTICWDLYRMVETVGGQPCPHCGLTNTVDVSEMGQLLEALA